MSTDPFEQFQRSRAGLLIPVAIFLLGALLTIAALRALDPYVMTTEEREALIEQQQADVASMLDPEIQSGLKETGIDLDDIQRRVQEDLESKDAMNSSTEAKSNESSDPQQNGE